MQKLKEWFLYILALVVLLAPVIILGWIGLSLLSWPGLILGIIGGLAIFVASVNKIGQEETTASEDESDPPLLPEQPAPEESSRLEAR